MKYILVSYRPNGADYARSCLVGTSPSDHDISKHDTVAEAVQHAARLDVKHESELEYDAWEHTLIGPTDELPFSREVEWMHDYDYDIPGVIDLPLDERFPEWAEMEEAKQQARKKAEKAAAARRAQLEKNAAHRKRARDLKELERLRNAYPDR